VDELYPARITGRKPITPISIGKQLLTRTLHSRVLVFCLPITIRMQSRQARLLCRRKPSPICWSAIWNNVVSNIYSACRAVPSNPYTTPSPEAAAGAAYATFWRGTRPEPLSWQTVMRAKRAKSAFAVPLPARVPPTLSPVLPAPTTITFPCWRLPDNPHCLPSAKTRSRNQAVPGSIRWPCSGIAPATILWYPIRCKWKPN